MESLIQLHNYRPHPTDRKYMVFVYHDYEMACSFEDALVEQEIQFEKDVTESGPNKRWLYAIRKRDMEQAKKCNNLAIGLHRKPFISDPVLRYFVIGIFLLLMTLVIIGYINS
ncbi:MAG: hypothetical protein HKN79_11840 [Flavobacteriales bacterium]|nr:hypothetical protein [Flavobacteriales bacterium]